MATIKISGYDVLVDEEDVQRITDAGPWFINAYSDAQKRNASARFVNANNEYLHIFIFDGYTKPKAKTKFLNANRFDCRKENLSRKPIKIARVVTSLKLDPVGSCRIFLDPDEVLVDTEDCERILSSGPWFLLTDGRLLEGNLRYYFRHVRVGGVHTTERLHRFLIGAKRGDVVDHIVPSNTLDNRKSNLRIVTPRINSYNSKMSKNNTSGFKGVTWSCRDKKWAAQLMVTRVNMQRKSFQEKEDAVAYRAYLEQKYAPGVLMGVTGREAEID